MNPFLPPQVAFGQKALSQPKANRSGHTSEWKGLERRDSAGNCVALKCSRNTELCVLIWTGRHNARLLFSLQSWFHFWEQVLFVLLIFVCGHPTVYPRMTLDSWFLSPSPQCWHDNHMPPHLVYVVLVSNTPYVLSSMDWAMWLTLPYGIDCANLYSLS